MGNITYTPHAQMKARPINLVPLPPRTAPKALPPRKVTIETLAFVFSVAFCLVFSILFFV